MGNLDGPGGSKKGGLSSLADPISRLCRQGRKAKGHPSQGIGSAISGELSDTLAQ